MGQDEALRRRKGLELLIGLKRKHGEARRRETKEINCCGQGSACLWKTHYYIHCASYSKNFF
jgi:hypothetical protein